MCVEIVVLEPIKGIGGVQPPEPGPEPITAREAGLWDGALVTFKMADETERSLTAEPSTVLNKLNFSLKPQQSTISESKQNVNVPKTDLQ